MKTIEERIVETEKIRDCQNFTQYRKNMKLAEIMTEMEYNYKIPILNDENYNKSHPDVIAAYRKISAMRIG